MTDDNAPRLGYTMRRIMQVNGLVLSDDGESRADTLECGHVTRVQTDSALGVWRPCAACTRLAPEHQP